MTRISKSVWERLRKAGIIDTYDKDLRNEQIRKAGPWKLMSIAGIGVRTGHALLKNAGWNMPLAELEKVYDRLHERTKYEFVKARPKERVEITQSEAKPEKKDVPAQNQDKRERRYVAFLIKELPQFAMLFEIVKKGGGIPYDGKVPHKLLHLTIVPPQDILFKDVLAKLYGIANFKLPFSFEIAEPHKFPNSPKIMFLGKLNIPFNLLKTPHLTFGEFDEDERCRKFYNDYTGLLNEFNGMKMEIEVLSIVRKGFGIEYAIPILALIEEQRKFIPEQIKIFLEFLGHKNPIKYQVFKPSIDGKPGGSGRNTYAGNVEEVVNLASMDNGHGIVCVAIGEHGEKQTEDISNITKLLALTIDVDVKKDRKISYVSSREDHLHAINVAYTIVRRELERKGFKVGIINDSGNGAHVYVKVGIALPENMSREEWSKTEIYGRLVALENALRTKIKEMNDDIVNIDFITKDAVRRVKLPGTINKKDVNQAEDRVCKMIYKADDYAEEQNNKAFLAIEPTIEKTNISERSSITVQESQTVMPEPEVARIFEQDPKLKALFEGNIVAHGEDKPLEFKDGKIYCKSRSEAENSLVSGLVSHGIRNFEQINQIMIQAKIGKWQEDRRGGYRKKTFEKALSFIKTTKIPQKSGSSDLEKARKAIRELK